MKKFIYFLTSFFIIIAPMGNVYSSNIGYIVDAVAVSEKGSPQSDVLTVASLETKQLCEANKDRNEFDQQIYDLFKSETFQKLSLNYVWDGKSYSILFVYNPNRATLWDSGLKEPVKWPFAMTINASSYPLALAAHLKSLVPTEFLRDSNSVIDVADWPHYWREYSVSIYKSLHLISGENDDMNKFNQEINNLFKSETFKQLSLNYVWEGTSYPVLFIYNPMREILWGKDAKKPVQWLFAMTINASSYPLAFAKYLKSFVPKELLNDSDSVVDIGDWYSFKRQHSVSFYRSLHPVSILYSIENPDIDAELHTFFSSEQLAERILYYELDGEFYRVLLIHNPEKVKLQSTLGFESKENGRLTKTVNWKSKIGIFVSDEGPQELINHFSQFYSLSWLGKKRNRTIRNGDLIKVVSSDSFYVYTHYPYSWYDYMIYAEPK